MKLMVRTAGGSRGNPGPAAAGGVSQNEAGIILFEGGFFLGRQTNNVAEYQGIIHALERAKKIGGTHLTIFSDSQLLVRQLNGEYKVKNEVLKGYFEQANRLLREFEKVSIEHVYREENADADAMVNQALDAQADVGGPAVSGIQVSPRQSDPEPELENRKNGADIAAKIQFDPKHPQPKRLNESGKLAMELVCLNPKQKWEKPLSQETAVLVYQGHGCLVNAGQEETISKGSCLVFSSGEKAVFRADREPVILVLTTILPDPAETSVRSHSRF